MVFYWPFEFDPAVRREFPGGWQDLDYVISTQGMRNDTQQVRRTAQALEHSTVVVTFGRGDQKVEIRKIERPEPIAAVAPRPGSRGSG